MGDRKTPFDFSLTPFSISREILDLILDDLDIADRTKLLRLNRQWLTFANQEPRLWTKLDFGNRSIHADTLDKICAKSKYMVTKCRVMSAVDFLEPVLQKCSSSIQEVELGNDLRGTIVSRNLPRSLPSLRDLTIHSSVTLETALELIHNHQSTLRSATFSRIIADISATSRLPQSALQVSPLLRKLSFRGDRGVHMSLPPELLLHAMGLEELSLESDHTYIPAGLQHLQSLRCLKLKQPERLYHLLLPPILQDLSIHFGDHIEIEASRIAALPKLRKLSLSSSSFLLPSAVAIILCILKEVGSELSILRLMFKLPELESQALLKGLLHGSCTSGQLYNLEKLSIESLYRLNDESLASIGGSCPKLREITLASCPEITGKGVRGLVGRLEHVEMVTLALCPRVGDETRQWLLDQDIYVVPLPKSPVFDRFQSR